MDLDRPWAGERAYDQSLDISHDLLSMKPLTVESGSAELAHSRYSIEHLTGEAALFFFMEVLRILMPKGIFRVVAPNIDFDYRAYKRGTTLREAGFETVYRSAAEQSASPVMRNEVYFDNRFQKCMFYMEAVKD